jgi:phospholipid/cholesterol/gamma-HCH transport system permease protein
MTNESVAYQDASITLKILEEQNVLKILLQGKLNAYTSAPVWKQTLSYLDSYTGKRVILDTGKLEYCDVSGIAFIGDIRQRVLNTDKDFSMEDLAVNYQNLLKMFPENLFAQDKSAGNTRRNSFPSQIGLGLVGLCRDMRNTIEFIGELTCGLFKAVRYPKRIRWADLMYVVETAGVNALPIIALIGFLLGLILAFQAAVPMSEFGAGIFVANLVALSLVRELGPLITAIMLAGRSGSSFAAELGTMKVNDEIDALLTMGFNPLFFLAVPRVLAGLVVSPLLALFSIAFGLVGAGIVVLSMGYPLITYIDRVISSVTIGDMTGGLFKAVIFGGLVAAVGCMRGLQTKAGAQAVGDSTTSSVVTGIILIAVTDGLFAVLFYVLGI